MMVVGEPGIGKTRLAQEFAVYAALRGARVLWGRCYEGEVVPYQPFVEALASYEPRLSSLEGDEAALLKAFLQPLLQVQRGSEPSNDHAHVEVVVEVIAHGHPWLHH